MKSLWKRIRRRSLKSYSYFLFRRKFHICFEKFITYLSDIKLIVMMSRLFLRILSLYEEGDVNTLKIFLADVNNLRRIKSRALRLRVWRKVKTIRWRILDVTVRTLQKVRSNTLLDTLIKIVSELIPNLLTRFEDKLYNTMKYVREIMYKYALESKSLFLRRLSRDEKYIFSEALKLLTSSEQGFNIELWQNIE